MKNNTALTARSKKDYIEIVFWAMAQLLWGACIWFFSFGPGKNILRQAPLYAYAIALTAGYFYRPLMARSLKTHPFLFDIPITIPRWIYLIAGTLCILTAYFIASRFFGVNFSPIVHSLVFGVCASACVEELAARSILAKYSLSSVGFIIFNLVSSLAFTLMHAGFQNPAPTLYALLVNGHFQFSFMLGIIVYKSQRIELTLLLHAASNLVNYTLPTLLLMQPLPLLSVLFWCSMYLILGGISKKKWDSHHSLARASMFS